LDKIASATDRLESWKEIAAHLDRSVRTVRRWEAEEGLPVHRLRHEKGGSVYGYKPELDVWRQSRELIDERPRQELSPQPTESLARRVTDSTIPQNGTMSAQSSGPSLTAPTRLWFWRVVTVANILIAILIAIYGIRQFSNDEGEPLTVVPLTSYPGNELEPSISPDGNQVAFAFNDGRSSNCRICVKSIGSEEAIPLTSAQGDDRSPSWSPDGQNIVFLRFLSDQSATVMVKPFAGGAERQLAKILVDRSHNTEIRVTWSPDGEWLATSECETSLSPMRLLLISATTGEKRRLVYQLATEDADLSPSFSPDGRYLAFARHISPAVADIYVLELPRNGRLMTPARRLTSWNRMNRSPVWAGGGQEILFVGDAPRLGPRIWRIPVFRSGEPRPVNQIGEDSSSLALCLPKSRLVYSKTAADLSIWRIDQGLVPVAPACRRRVSLSRWIASTRYDANPQYSPDGTYIAYQSERSGYEEIWVANSDGSASRQLTRLQSKVSGYPRWSPDSKHIVFHSRPSGYANLFIVDVDTRAYRQLTTGTTNDAAPSWSHDGRWIYFESRQEGSSQIWRVPSVGGPATRLTKNGGTIALESVDGKLLYFSKTSEAGLWVLSLEGGAESQILPSLYGMDTFAITKRGIYFVRHAADAEASVSFMDFYTRDIQEIARVKCLIASGLTVSPDERSILYTQIDRTGSDLILVDNFR